MGTAVDHWGNGEEWGGKRYFPALRPELVAGIESVGAEGTPSLERILKLQPDLILLADQAEQAYKQLSAIAPTALVDIWRDKIPIKESCRYIAQLVGQGEKAEEIINQYHERVEEFRKRLGNRIRGLEISVIGHYDSQFVVSPISANYFQVFQDLGLPIKPVFLKQNGWSSISIEAIDKYDGDILFIVEDVRGSSSYLSQNPLISSLKSVRNNQAYIVNRKIWDFYGPIGMNLFLDDLSRYLLEGKQDSYFQSQ